MGWSNSRLLGSLIDIVRYEFSNEEERVRAYRKIIPLFEEFDFDVFDECLGIDHAFDDVYRGNYAKFKQGNDFLIESLMATKGTTLVEASPVDNIWGIGLKSDNPDALDRSKWKGTNWLGDILTKVRHDLYQLG